MGVYKQMISIHIIYARYGRVLKIVPYNIMYSPVKVKDIGWYLFRGTLPEDIHERMDQYSFSLKKGFFNHFGELKPEEKEKCKKGLIKIQILERLHDISIMQKMYYTSNEFGSELYHSILNSEIQEYKKNNTIGPVLEAFYESYNGSLTYDAIVGKQNVLLKDAAYAFAYIKKLENKINNLLTEEKFDEARMLIENEYLKSRK